MLPNLDTYAAAADIDRALTLKRAERRARLLEAAKRPRSTPVDRSPDFSSARWGRLVRTVRSVRWSLRPSHV